MVRDLSAYPRDGTGSRASDEQRACSLIRDTLRGSGLSTSFVADALALRIGHYGERYFESGALADMLTSGLLTSTLLRPASADVRRWTTRNIDSIEQDDAQAVRLSALDASGIETALLQELLRAHKNDPEAISPDERKWTKHLASDMQIAALRSLVAAIPVPRILAALDDLALRLATGDPAKSVEDILTRRQ